MLFFKFSKLWIYIVTFVRIYISENVSKATVETDISDDARLL